MVLFIVILLIVFAWLVTVFSVSGAFADLADKKGYDWYNAFWLCFFLGIIGYIIVLARKNLRKAAKTKV